MFTLTGGARIFRLPGTARALEFILWPLQKIMRSFFISSRSLPLHCKNEWWYTWQCTIVENHVSKNLTYNKLLEFGQC